MTDTQQRALLVRGRDAAGLGADLLGGKGASLARLTALALPVPDWICLTTEASRLILAPHRSLIEPMMQDLDPGDRQGIEKTAAEIAAILEASPLPEEVAFLLGSELGALGPWMAVRSSAVGEDSADHSFAGQLDTFLSLRKEDVPKAILGCIASLYGSRAIAYRLVSKLPNRDLAVAVVIQRMAKPEVSGVLFTANPQTGDRGEFVVTAAFGLGEGVVAEKVPCDTFVLEAKTGSIIRKTIADKTERILSREQGGTEPRPVSEALRRAPCLSAAKAHALAGLGRKVTEGFSRPQDIEFAFDDSGTLLLLQSRPITRLGEVNETAALFDNANIVEGYPGLTLPLTFSFVRRAYEITFAETSRRLGVPEESITPSLHGNLLALLSGRVYYNMQSWYALFGQIPGFDRFLPAWHKALGLEGIAPPPPTGHRMPLSALVRLLRLYRAGDGEARRYLDRLATKRTAFRAIDLSRLSSHQVLDLEADLEKELLAPYAVSALNDLFIQQTHRLTSWLLTRARGEEPLLNELLAAGSEMESIRPLQSLAAIAGIASRIDGAANAIREARTASARRHLWRRFQEEKAFAALKTALDDHLAAYGDRTFGELKLETPSLEEEPELLLALVANHMDGERSEAHARQATSIRREADMNLRKLLAHHPFLRPLLSRALRATRRTVKLREDLRLARTRGFGMVKRIYRELGRRLFEAALIESPEDIFYLGIDEVAGLVRGQSLTANPEALIRLRKRDYQAFAKESLPSRITTSGIVAAAALASDARDAARGSKLQGIGCGKGRVEGTAKIVLHPRQAPRIDGEILIAPMTDPGWIFLMAAASGLVSERGSILSHTAIVGRELGIPTVVNVKDATRIIPDGARITLDAAAGTVTITIEEEETKPPH